MREERTERRSLPDAPSPAPDSSQAEQGQGLLGKRVDIVQRARRGRIFVLLATGFEEHDVTTVTRTLRRIGLPVVLVGLTTGPIRGCHGISLAPDRTLSEVETEHPLAVVLPGGIQGVRHLNADPRVPTLLRMALEREGHLLALDAGYMILVTSGILDKSKQRPATGPVQLWQDDAQLLQRVVVEGKVIYGSNSGAAQESALTLAALLEAETYSGEGLVHRIHESW